MSKQANSYYLSDENNLHRAQEDTGLCVDEIESIVGRFANHSWRKGLLRGEVVVYVNKVVIRHHFNKKKLWEGNYD